MEEKALKNFRFDHGLKTWRMAWVVEYCLFTLGISIAGFNIFTGILEGNLASQILLAIGWLILGTIELATIPLAGALRLSKGIGRIWCSVGVAGLVALSTFTVFEFNEIASEYMTRGARKAAIEVTKIEGQTQGLQKDLDDLESREVDKANKEDGFKRARLAELEEEKKRYAAEEKRIEEYYAGLLEESVENSQFPIYNGAEEARIESADRMLNELQTTLGGLQDSLAKTTIEARTADSRAKKVEVEGLRAKIEALESQISSLEADKDKRISEVEGTFFKSAESKVADIQNGLEPKLEDLRNEKDLLIDAITKVQLREIVSPPEAISLNDSITEVKGQIEELEARKKNVRDIASVRMDTPEFQTRVADLKEEEKRVQIDRRSAKNTAKNRFEERTRKIEKRYEFLKKDYDESAMSVAELGAKKSEKLDQLEELRAETTKITEEAAEKYEQVMYFRMASWFSGEDATGFGKLPQKEHYNSALRNIFLPVGFFFAAVSIVLAYVGAGFMYEESRKHDAWIPMQKLKDENEELLKQKEKLSQHNDLAEARISSLSYFKEKADEKMQAAVMAERLKLESAIDREANLKKKQVELEKRIQDRDRLLTKNEEDLIKAKQRVFEAIRAVPQTITVIESSEGKDT